MTSFPNGTYRQLTCIGAISTVFSLSVAAPLVAQSVAWGDEGGCARVAGEVVQTDMVFILWPDRIERHESTCRITGMEGDLNTRAVIDAECSGEGEVWTTSYGMTSVGDAFSIWPVEAPEFITELRPCP